MAAALIAPSSSSHKDEKSDKDDTKIDQKCQEDATLPTSHIVVEQLKLRNLPILQVYKIIRSLRDSLYGTVLLAADRITNSLVVVKRSSLKHAKAKQKLRANKRIQEDLFLEIKIHSYLSSQKDLSPYILRIIDTFHDDGWINMVLEHAKGGDVFDYIASKAPGLSPKEREVEFGPYIKQLIHAVHYLHSHGICHRDLSLENAVFDILENGLQILKLIDFGTAIVTANWKPKKFVPVGKPKYMSHELQVHE